LQHGKRPGKPVKKPIHTVEFVAETALFVVEIQ
jgi:hypothetical protein